jgi:hypothetical protein
MLILRFSSTIDGGDSLETLFPLSKWENIYDNNDPQTFCFDSKPRCRYLRLNFASSSDFYGRIIIYNMEVYGDRSS